MKRVLRPAQRNTSIGQYLSAQASALAQDTKEQVFGPNIRVAVPTGYCISVLDTQASIVTQMTNKICKIIFHVVLQNLWPKSHPTQYTLLISTRQGGVLIIHKTLLYHEQG